MVIISGCLSLMWLKQCHEMPVTGNGVYIYIYIYVHLYIYIYVISSITWWRLGDGLLLNEQPRFKHITHILGNLHNKIPWKLRLYPLNPLQIYTGRYLQFQAPDTYSSWMVANLKWPLHDTTLHLTYLLNPCGLRCTTRAFLNEFLRWHQHQRSRRHDFSRSSGQSHQRGGARSSGECVDHGCPFD